MHAGCRPTPTIGVVCARSTARCSLDLSRRNYNEYPAFAPRVSGVGPARFEHVWRHAGLGPMHASSSAHRVKNAHSE